MSDTTPVLTTGDAAKYLQVSERTLIRWRVQRKGPAWTYVGRQVRYRHEDLNDYLIGRKRRPVAEVS
jgi:excisionase family DNA binding protein